MENLARDAIRALGARVTATRVHVLAALMGSPSALSHQELFDRIGSTVSVDRVTVYRVLEWLVQSGLAHRIAGEDRVWRFSVAGHGEQEGAAGLVDAHQHHQSDPHGHFQCDSCRRMFCIDAPVGIEQNLERLPEGFEGRDVEMVVRGLCPACAQSRLADQRPTHRRGKSA